MIIIIDFGSQYTHYIGRRLKELGCDFKIILPEIAMDSIKTLAPQGIILSGGPDFVDREGAPTIPKHVFELGIPILGICYGWQLMSYLLGGEGKLTAKEFGPETLHVTNAKSILNLPQKDFTVIVSHGYSVTKLPIGFETIASTESVLYSAAINEEKKLFGIQFHPEVQHTEYGIEIIKNFIAICGVKTTEYTINPQEIEDTIKTTVGSNVYVIGAASGGVDSTVAGILTAKAIGNRYIPIYVENGLMRDGTKEDVEKIYRNVGIEPRIVHVEEEMLEKLKGKTDPEEKRKVIGAFYIQVFEREMEILRKEGKNVQYLLQGTIYSDVIESKGTKHADKIKSHHNVGGLPERLQLQLLEPMRDFYKDEVRKIGAMLGIPEEFVQKQKFPGPGYGIRIRGEVTPERLAKEKQADHIVVEEITKAGWLPKVLHSFPVMTDAQSTSVKGDERFFGEVIALRITTSTDEMTCGWAHLPYDLLQRISSRIVNEVPNISRVVYDITTKPPATMEWE